MNQTMQMKIIYCMFVVLVLIAALTIFMVVDVYGYEGNRTIYLCLQTDSHSNDKVCKQWSNDELRGLLNNLIRQNMQHALNNN